MPNNTCIKAGSELDRKVEILGKAPYGDCHSSWNDILLATRRPTIRGAWRSLNEPPPASFPDINEFYGFFDVDLGFLSSLPAFWHWKHFGNEVGFKDMDLLNFGNMSLIDLFRRGPVGPLWYERLHDADKALAKGPRGKLHKHFLERIQKSQRKLKPAKADGDEEEIKRVLQELRDLRASELALRYGCTVRVSDNSPADPFQILVPVQLPESHCFGTVEYVDRKVRTSSDADLRHPHRSHCVHDSLVSPHHTS